MKKTEKELFDWLEDHQGFALVSDDNGHWACVCDGTQSLPLEDGPQDIDTSFWIRKEEWKDTIREAIEASIAEDEQ
jgi:hypothetical protein